MPAGTTKGVMPEEDDMADEDGNDGAGEQQQSEGEGQQAPETGGDDLAGLRSALQKERDANKRLQRQYANFDQIKSKASQYDELKRAAQTDQERAVVEARTAAEAEAAKTWGSRLVGAELRGRLAGRITDDDERVQAAIDSANHSRFLADDGSVDTEALQKYVDLIAPATPRRVPDTGGGNRGSVTKNLDMSSLIRQAAGRTG